MLRYAALRHFELNFGWCQHTLVLKSCVFNKLLPQAIFFFSDSFTCLYLRCQTASRSFFSLVPIERDFLSAPQVSPLRTLCHTCRHSLRPILLSHKLVHHSNTHLHWRWSAQQWRWGIFVKEHNKNGRERVWFNCSKNSKFWFCVCTCYLGMWNKAGPESLQCFLLSKLCTVFFFVVM